MEIFDYIVENIFVLAPRILGAIVTLVFGWWLIKIITKISVRYMNKAKADVSLIYFLKNLIKISLRILLFISVISMLGVQMTSFIAIIGAAGLAIGLALQGSLANFAGGVLILIFKLYKIGDFIETSGFTGTVEQIQIFNTVLNTPDNKRIIIPNGHLSNNSIINYTANPIRRVDIRIGVSYKENISNVKTIISEVINKHELVLKEPEPLFRVIQLAQSSVDFTIRVWTQKENYWSVFYDLTEELKTKFDEENINIPFPQMDISIKK